jgi:hypothetical protein
VSQPALYLQGAEAQQKGLAPGIAPLPTISESLEVRRSKSVTDFKASLNCSLVLWLPRKKFLCQSGDASAKNEIPQTRRVHFYKLDCMPVDLVRQQRIVLK